VFSSVLPTNPSPLNFSTVKNDQKEGKNCGKTLANNKCMSSVLQDQTKQAMKYLPATERIL
jgi:hypothetical protein